MTLWMKLHESQSSLSLPRAETWPKFGVLSVHVQFLNLWSTLYSVCNSPAFISLGKVFVQTRRKIFIDLESRSGQRLGRLYIDLYIYRRLDLQMFGLAMEPWRRGIVFFKTIVDLQWLCACWAADLCSRKAAFWLHVGGCKPPWPITRRHVANGKDTKNSTLSP